MKKVIIVDDLHPFLRDELQRKGFEVSVDLASSKEEISSKIDCYDGLVIRARFGIDKNFIDAHKHLRFIARAGAGMENIDVKYAEQVGIKCLSSPEGNRDAVAEHAMAMLLALLNKIIKSDGEVRRGIWARDDNWGTTLKGKTVGVIGYGYMGEAFARLLPVFGVRVLVYDKYKTNFGNDYIEESAMEAIFREADILSLHVPLTPETKWMVDAEYLNKFKKPLILINTSRGANVVTSDLMHALESGKVTGACLDVLEYESANYESLFSGEIPAPLKYLTQSNRVILSPHVAGWTDESYRKHSEVLAEKIIALY